MVSSVELSKFKASIERDREKEVEHNMAKIIASIELSFIVMVYSLCSLVFKNTLQNN